MGNTDRLSSDNLYHFKQNPRVVESILSNGFRHNLWPEMIPYKTSEQHNFLVCFCDIKIEEATYHRSVYGNNALVLTKDWGMRNGVSPVRYVHEESPGLSASYIRMKNRFREMRGAAEDHPDTLTMHYAIQARLQQEGLLTHDTLAVDIVALGSRWDVEEEKFTAIFDAIKGTANYTELAAYLRSLTARIADLHNELERRDALMRVYKGDFSTTTGGTIKDKILYDEREWRSVKFPDKADYVQGVTNKHLPPKYNLTFTDADILAILCQDQQTLDSLKSYIESNTILTDKDKTIAKLRLIDEHTE